MTEPADFCCTPGRAAEELAQPQPSPSPEPAPHRADHAWAQIPAGTFTMGTERPERWAGDGEGPARPVTLPGYRIARHAVTSNQFAGFVAATGHRTEAEAFGGSFVFGLLLPDDFPPTRGVAGAPWWRLVEGADWSHPFGPQSSWKGLEDHPAVHISHNDAAAYCAWAGVRLPSEAEWERAARGGLEGKRFVWGDEFAPDGRTMCNIFEGTFPGENTAADGYVGTAPVDAFPPNGFGLHNTAGNVWEWCADWFQVDRQRLATGGDPVVDPAGPSSGTARVIRGGSYLCHDSYCDRYRVAARSSNTPDSSTGNMGFRVALDLPSTNE